MALLAACSTGLLLMGQPGLLHAQGVDPARDAAEQRRAAERGAVLRQQQERTPDVRADVPMLPPEAEALALRRLPGDEAPCFPIQQLSLAGEGAGRFGWLLDAAGGPGNDDHPLRKCLGAKGVDIVTQRLQAALRTRGYATTRVLVQPQELAGGTLSLTVLPGRVRSIRYAEPVDPRAGSLNAMPMNAGDILDARDIEQALDNYKRVPGAEVNIEIAAAGRPDESDLVVSYKAGAPFRASVSIDDSGTRATGKYQGAVTFSYDNWWTLNDLFYASVNRDLVLALCTAAGAQIVADPSAPGNQRATVLAAPNGVPLVNIQTPSAAGVSRNTYINVNYYWTVMGINLKGQNMTAAEQAVYEQRQALVDAHAVQQLGVLAAQSIAGKVGSGVAARAGQGADTPPAVKKSTGPLPDNMQADADLTTRPSGINETTPIKDTFGKSPSKSDLSEHLTVGGPSGPTKGVYGAHSDVAFWAELKTINGSLVQAPQELAPGIMQYSYNTPDRVAKGATPLTKTTYDSRYSDAQIIEMSKRASSQVWTEIQNGRLTSAVPAVQVVVDGVPFKVNLSKDMTGRITSIYSHPGKF